MSDLAYKTVVDEIRRLPWKSLDRVQLLRLMYIAYVAAQEFAEALRIALRVHKDDASLREMARGELKTDNLRFDDYEHRGDHWEFLAHFLAKVEFIPDSALQIATHEYSLACRQLSNEVRAATIFSREHELSGIFRAILENDHWEGETLEAFRYYLARHIELDTEQGGHADLVRQFEIGDEVLPFYVARRRVYDTIPQFQAS